MTLSLGALFLDNHGGQHVGVDPRLLAGIKNHLGIVNLLAVGVGDGGVQEGAVHQPLHPRHVLHLGVEALEQELEDAVLAQEVPGVHVVGHDLPGRCHPATAVIGSPHPGVPVVGLGVGGLPAGLGGGLHQAVADLGLLVYGIVPVKAVVVCPEHPFGVHGVEQLEPVPIGLREALLL